MGLHCLYTDAKRDGRFLVALALSYKLRELACAGSKTGTFDTRSLAIQIAGENDFRDFAREKWLVGVSRTNRWNKMRGGIGFYGVISRSNVEDLIHKIFVLMRDKLDYLDPGHLPFDLARRFESIQFWHGQIEHDNVGLNFLRQRDGFAPVSSFTTNLPP